ncbi:hypothetical protein MFLO_02393 [Listeria floridensis FSL S10-1187]|uniref:Uncharacterized protein n=1 Tax=Listeria floridensis FSL S10-1187 TaxID=1265817 RepID=A0ABN0RI03_9LIST|nr:hypothetical protein [Listeria floridensis]EUJ33515.1 hypothetical protein MFLO_02393 [Listeria floridensis FSL S10-1187]
MSDFKKMESPLLNSAFKNDYNDNLDLIEELFGSTFSINEALNQRVSNLVVDAGGDDITEVVDSRVAKLYPEMKFLTLKDRLDYFEDALFEGVSKVSTQIVDLNQRYSNMEQIISRIYGLDQSTIKLYVDATKGSDVDGTGSFESPYKTINKAVAQLPRLLSVSVFIWINPGRYDEDVILSNINGAKINILGTNYETVDPSTGPTGVQIRSLLLEDVVGSVLISGLEQTNTVGTTQKYFIRVNRCGFVRIQKCRMAYNTKSNTDFTCVFIDACKADVNFCHFVSQSVDVRGYNAADVIVQKISHGTNSGTGLYPQSSIIYNTDNIVWKADIPERTSGGGKVLKTDG